MIPNDERDYDRIAAAMGWNKLSPQVLGGLLHYLFHYYVMRLRRGNI